MKRRIYKRRRDGVYQHYLKNFGMANFADTGERRLIQQRLLMHSHLSDPNNLKKIIADSALLAKYAKKSDIFGPYAEELKSVKEDKQIKEFAEKQKMLLEGYQKALMDAGLLLLKKEGEKSITSLKRVPIKKTWVPDEEA